MILANCAKGLQCTVRLNLPLAVPETYVVKSTERFVLLGSISNNSPLLVRFGGPGNFTTVFGGSIVKISLTENTTQYKARNRVSTPVVGRAQVAQCVQFCVLFQANKPSVVHTVKGSAI
ncbi:uncharacterized protein LOC143235428 [Tachypleus tridentatus]|uniref:uncharacterized protein LOC143235428 n=1 Tax=Tachypleus tridentatus TaxID=6853 RepID=UPI003FD3FCBE